MSEIKGAPCTRRAHFHGRVHDFRRCAPGVCTFFEPFIIAIYQEGAWTNVRVHSFRGSAPCESLISAVSPLMLIRVISLDRCDN